MTHWVQTLRRAALSGTAASTLSLAALSFCGVRDCRSAFAPVNAVSHWIWARRALCQDDGSLRYTLPGYAIHHAASVFWALIYEEGVARVRPARAAHHIGASAAVAGIACFVDLRMTPEHAARPSFREIQKLGEDWEPDFDSLYNFPPASRLSMIARLRIGGGRVQEAGFIPLYIDRDAVPRPPAPTDPRFTEVIDYLRAVTEEVGLNGRYTPRGAHVAVEAA